MSSGDPERYRREFTANAKEARRLLQGLTERQANWRPGPDRWSIAECVSHLTQVGKLYQTQFETAIARGREKGQVGRGPFRHDWFGGWFAASMEPPPKRSLKRPAAFAPDSYLMAGAVCEEYLEVNRALLAIMRDADGLDWARIKMTSPLTRLMRFNLAAGFAIVAAHDRRHLCQARQVLDRPEFPAT